MRNKIIFIYTFFLTITFLRAQVKPTLQYDSSSGNYLLLYHGLTQDQRDTLYQVVYEPRSKLDPAVKIKVSKFTDQNFFSYAYTLLNGSLSVQRLSDFYLDIFSHIANIGVPDTTWETGFFSYIPVFSWNNFRSKEGLPHPYDGIARDSSLYGFSFNSSGLPVIVKAYFSGRRSIPLIFPDPDEPPSDAESIIDSLTVFPNDALIKFTIGPSDPPFPFVPLDFIDTLKSYVNQSFSLGWIADKKEKDDKDKGGKIVKELIKYLDAAHAQLAKNKTKEAKKKLEEFVKKVEEYYGKNSEEEKEKKERGSFTSEAYALLKYNTEYLIGQLK